MAHLFSNLFVYCFHPEIGYITVLNVVAVLVLEQMLKNNLFKKKDDCLSYPPQNVCVIIFH